MFPYKVIISLARFYSFWIEVQCSTLIRSVFLITHSNAEPHPRESQKIVDVKNKCTFVVTINDHIQQIF